MTVWNLLEQGSAAGLPEVIVLKLSFMSCRCVGKEELTKAERICAGAKSVVEIRFVLLTK